MNNRTLLDDSPDGLDDLDFDVERANGSDEGPIEAEAIKRPLPAWRRIEEYREMRELNRRVEDDIYGYRPIHSLWDWDAI